jgi:hypothetical protein
MSFRNGGEMTKKAEFNAEEWTTLLEGPPSAGLLVIAAQRGGTLRESISMGKAYSEAQGRHDSSELMQAIVNSRPELERPNVSSPQELEENLLGRLREATALLEQKATPEEADEYKRFCLHLAETAARAHKEGGFLGIGGQEVSDAESAALDRIASTLGIEREAPPTG